MTVWVLRTPLRHISQLSFLSATVAAAILGAGQALAQVGHSCVAYCDTGSPPPSYSYSAPSYTPPPPPPVYQPSPAELANRQAVALNNQGLALDRKGRHAEAIRLYKAALRVGLFPNNAAITRRNLVISHSDYAATLIEAGDVTAARAQVEEAKSHSINDKSVTSNLQWIEMRVNGTEFTQQRDKALVTARDQIVRGLRSKIEQTMLTYENVQSSAGLDFVDNASKVGARDDQKNQQAPSNTPAVISKSSSYNRQTSRARQFRGRLVRLLRRWRGAILPLTEIRPAGLAAPRCKSQECRRLRRPRQPVAEFPVPYRVLLPPR